MKASKISKVLTSMLIAGVVLATPASASNQNPPGELVTPTLGGLEVQGDAAFENASVSGELAVSTLIDVLDISISGALSNVAGDILIDDSLDISGGLKVGTAGGATGLSIGADEIETTDDDLLLNPNSGEHVVVGSSEADSRLDIYGSILNFGAMFVGSDLIVGSDILVGGDLAVYDVNADNVNASSVSAFEIGEFQQFQSVNYHAMAPNGVNNTSNATICPGNSVPVGCGVVLFNQNGGSYSNYTGPGVNLNWLTPNLSTNGCHAQAYNTTASTLYMKIRAVCFSPNGDFVD